MLVVSGPLTWWANRKSRIGMSPAALKPPHVNGKEWWTTPPTALPQPEHIEYAVAFMREVQLRPQTSDRDALLGHISDWLKMARRLLHEEVESQRGDLHTTDGLIVAAGIAMQRLLCKCGKAGLLTPDEDREFCEVRQALVARSARISRERALKSSKRVSRPYWEDRKP